MTQVMPSLMTHGCSYQEEGGFLRRVKEGTWAGHVVEHLALELQTLAGMDTGYGRTRETGEKGIYNVVFSYVEEQVGRFAGRAAVRLWVDLAEGKPIAEINEGLAKDIREMREIREDVRFGPSTGSLVEEADNRDIPFIRLNDHSLVQLGYGVHQKRIQATTTVNTNMISVDIAGNKHATKKLLGDMGVPVPKGYQDPRDRGTRRHARARRLSGRDKTARRQSRQRRDGRHQVARRRQDRLGKGKGIFTLYHCRETAYGRRLSRAGSQ